MTAVGDKQTITIVAVPEIGARNEREVCAECVFNSLQSCIGIDCSKGDNGNGEDVIFVTEAEAHEYIVRAMERRMES